MALSLPPKCEKTQASAYAADLLQFPIYYITRLSGALPDSLAYGMGENYSFMLSMTLLPAIEPEVQA